MRKLLWNATWIIVRPLLKFFCHFEIEGQEYLKEVTSPVIIASNHANYLDAFILGAALPFNSKLFPIRFITANMYIKRVPLGKIITLYGAVPIFKGRGLERSLEEAVNLLKNRQTVGIFPEGKRTKNGRIGYGKTGVAYLGQISKVPIVPIALLGTFKMSYKDFLLRKKKISVSFGKPFILKQGEFIKGADGIMRDIRALAAKKDKIHSIPSLSE